MVEFVLAGIPVIFVLISIFELSRGMWTYHTMAYAVREGVRYAAVHGKGCASPHTCQVTIGQITSVIKAAGAGLPPSTTVVTFTPASGSASSATMTSQLTSTHGMAAIGGQRAGTEYQDQGDVSFPNLPGGFLDGRGRRE